MVVSHGSAWMRRAVTNSQVPALGGQLGAGVAFTLNKDCKMTVPSHWVG